MFGEIFSSFESREGFVLFLDFAEKISKYNMLRQKTNNEPNPFLVLYSRDKKLQSEKKTFRLVKK